MILPPDCLLLWNKYLQWNRRLLYWRNFAIYFEKLNSDKDWYILYSAIINPHAITRSLCPNLK